MITILIIEIIVMIIFIGLTIILITSSRLLRLPIPHYY